MIAIHPVRPIASNGRAGAVLGYCRTTTSTPNLATVKGKRDRAIIAVLVLLCYKHDAL